ncbi:MAG TPA: tetratricopeptide repeat protein [Tepidisphaeraceae bacterium]|jgi:tetratricopeptide (TPR) repeat protein
MTQPTIDSSGPDSPRPPALRDLTVGSAGTLLLLVLVFVCYAASTQGGYVWEDDTFVAGNGVLVSFAGLSRIWTELGATPQYYPLTFTSFWLEAQLFGPKPQVSHIVNVALHAGSALLLWKILRRLSVPGAWAAAVVFAVHPIQVESVAWITERKNTLSMILALSAAWIYLNYARLGSDEAARPAGEGLRVPLPDEPARLYRLFLALFVLALLAKTMVAVLPLMLLVVVWWQRGRIIKADLLPLLPAFAIGLIAAAVTTYIEHHPYLVGATGPQWELSLPQRVMLLGQTCLFYAYKILWPFPVGVSFAKGTALWPMFPISFNYERWTIDPAGPLQWLPLVLVAATTAALFALRNRIGRGPLAGWLVFVVGVLPASGLVSFLTMRYSWVADHLAYFGSVGLIVAVVAALATLVRRWPHFAGGLTGVAVVALCAVTVWHSLAFRTSKLLWEHTWKQNPKSWLAALNYGTVVLDRANQGYQSEMKAGNEQLAVETRDENRRAADLWFQAGLRLNPNAYEGHLYSGVLAAQRGKPDEALAHFRRSEAVAGEMGVVGYRRPTLLIAETLAAQGQPDEALRVLTDLERAVADNPMLGRRNGHLFAQAHTLHGDVLRRSLKSRVGPEMPAAERATLEEAMGHYTAATDVAPDFVPAKVKLAAVLIEIAYPKEALQQLNDALRLDPNNLEAKLLTAMVAQKEGLFDAAVVQLQNLLSIRPDYLPAHLELARALQMMGRTDDALTELTNTARDFPNSQEAKRMLADLQIRTATQPATQGR